MLYYKYKGGFVYKEGIVMKEPREVFKENLQYFLRINGFSQADMARKMKKMSGKGFDSPQPLSESLLFTRFSEYRG